MKLTNELMASTDWAERLKLFNVSPAHEQQGASSKHPTVWILAYKPVAAAGVSIDGGEVFAGVDLEEDSATFVEY